MSIEQASPALPVGCPACLDPGRRKRHRARLGCSLIEQRRDQAVDLYRSGKNEREVAAQLGISPATAHHDLVERCVTPRPQTRGLNRGLMSAEHGRALQQGHHRYRGDVERVKAERGLIDDHELLERLRRAGAPRSAQAIDGHVRAGLIEPDRGLGFVKPRLFTTAAADELIARLKGYRDGRLRRFNATTASAARFRGEWYRARHGSAAEFGRLAPVIAAADGKQSGRRRELTDEQQARILELRARGGTGASVRAIAQNVDVGRGKVERFLKRETVTKPPLAL